MRELFHPKSWVGLLTEVVLIGLGVFLALMAEQWRVRREHQQNAQATLSYVREEVMVNRDAINKERPYHQKLAEEIQTFLQSDSPKTRQTFDATVHFTGVHPITFERTEWFGWMVLRGAKS